MHSHFKNNGCPTKTLWTRTGVKQCGTLSLFFGWNSINSNSIFHWNARELAYLATLYDLAQDSTTEQQVRINANMQESVQCATRVHQTIRKIENYQENSPIFLTYIHRNKASISKQQQRNDIIDVTDQSWHTPTPRKHLEKLDVSVTTMSSSTTWS